MSKKKELQKVNGIAEFKPTPLMEKFVEMAVQLGIDNVAEIARQTEMAETTYYIWKRQQGFSEWMNEYALTLLRGDGWKLNAIGMKNAKKDHRYWESMQKIVGNIKDNGNQTNLQTNIQVVMPNELSTKYGISRSTETDNQQ